MTIDHEMGRQQKDYICNTFVIYIKLLITILIYVSDMLHSPKRCHSEMRQIVGNVTLKGVRKTEGRRSAGF